MPRSKAQTILESADALLRDATRALDHFGQQTGEYIRDLRTIAVFGRSSFWALGNLSGIYPEYRARHRERREQMNTDELLHYFDELRNSFLKEGTPLTGNVGTVDVVMNKETGDISVGEHYYDPPIIPRAPRPTIHLGQPIDNKRIQPLCRMYLDWLSGCLREARDLVELREQEVGDAPD